MKTEKEKMLSGEPYLAFGDELREMRTKTFQATMKYNTTGNRALIDDIFEEKYNNLIVNAPFYCDYGQNVKFGDDVFVNFNCSFLACCEINIGSNCWIGPDVKIYTAIHPIDPTERNKGINLAKPVNIGKNCWIGGNTTILPGVSIGEGVTIGAGSIVTRNIPPHTVAVGNPCKVIKKIKGGE